MLDPDGHKTKTRHNRQSSAGLLRRHGVVFSEHNRGAHLVVYGDRVVVDFWPGTGKYIVRESGEKGRGVKNLLTLLER